MATDHNFKVKNGLSVGTTEVIDSSGNLTNIGTISSGAITSSGKVKGGSLETDRYIYHAGDTNTYIDFGADEINFHAGGGANEERLIVTASQITANRPMLIEKSTINGELLHLKNTYDGGYRDDLIIENTNDRDAGLTIKTAGGQYEMWVDSNGDDSLIFSAGDNTTDITMELYQNKNVDIGGNLQVAGNIETLQGIDFNPNGFDIGGDSDGNRTLFTFTRSGALSWQIWHTANQDLDFVPNNTAYKLQWNGNDVHYDGANISVGTVASGKQTITSTGTIGSSNISNGYLQITNGSNTLSIDPNEVMSNDTLYLQSSYGEVRFRGLNGGGAKLFNGSTQFMSASRDLLSIGTIASGAITTSSTVTADRMGYNAGGYSYLSQTSSGATTVLGHNVRAHASVNNRADTVNGSWHGHAIAMYYDRGISFYTTSGAVAAGTTVFSSNSDTTNLRMRITPAGNFQFRGGAFSDVGTIESGAITSSGNITTAGYITASEQSVFTGNSISGTPNTNAQLVAADSGVAGIAIQTNDGGSSYVWFGDTTDNAVGRIRYDHSSDEFTFRAGATDNVFEIDSSGMGKLFELTLKGGSDNLTFTETGGDWSIKNDQQNNGIVIYDGSGGVEIHYNDAVVAEFDSRGGMDLSSGALMVGGTTRIGASGAGTFSDVTLSDGSPLLTLSDTSNGGGGGAFGVIKFANTAGDAIAIGYTDDDSSGSDLYISTNAAGTYGGYMGLDAAGIADARADIVLEPKTNVRIATGGLKVGTSQFITSARALENVSAVQVGSLTSQNAFGALQVNQSANNDESGIAVLSSGAARSMRLWVDETTSYINSGNGGSGNLVFNQAITVSSGGNLTGVGTISSGTISSGAITASGNIVAEDAEVHVGDVSADSWTRIKHAQADGYGFDWLHDNATVIVNEQGTTNEALVLGDVDAGDYSGLFGISHSTDSGANWTKKLDLRGNGDLSVTGAITSSGKIVGTELEINSSANSDYLAGNASIATNGYIMATALINESETGANPSGITFGNGSTLGTDQISFITSGQRRIYINSGGAVDFGNGNLSSINTISSGAITSSGLITTSNSLHLGSGYNLSWGGQYSSGNPTIAANSNTIFFYPTGNVSGDRLSLNATGLTNAGTFTTGAITSSGNLSAGNSGNISMDGSANGQVEIKGSGYQGAIALDATAMRIYHNSASRNLVLGTNEAARLTIGSGGSFSFHGNALASVGSLNTTGALFLQVSSSDTAYQRVDTRDETGDQSRAHWYGVTATGGTSNFRHAWYDGSSYINVTAASNTVTFGGSLAATSRMQVGAYTSGDSSIIAQTGDIQLRVGSISIQHNPYIRLQASDGTNNVYADIKLDATNQKLVFNDPGTSSGSIGQSPMTLDDSGNLDVAGTVSAEVGKFDASGTTASACKLHVGAIQDTTSSAIAQFGGFVRFGGALILHNGSASGTQTHIEYAGNDLGFTTAIGSATGAIRANGYKIGSAGSEVINSTREAFFTNLTLDSSADNALTINENMQSTPARIHFNMTGNTTVGGGGAVLFETSTSGTDAVYNARIEGIRTSSDNGSSQINFWTTQVSSSTNAVKRMTLTESGNLIVTGNVTAYGSVSDIRLKENVEVIPDALEKVKKLDGVTFNYKKDGSRSTGLIAQQLQEVLEEAVYETADIESEETHLAIHYGNMVGLLIEAIKEQDEKIKKLEELVEKLISEK